MIWALIIAIGILVFLQRLSFILLIGRYDLPPRVRDALRFAPAAALSAIIFPSILYRSGVYHIDPTNPRLLAAGVAAVVAWRTHNAIATIATGMITLWLLQGLTA
jgi:branched-subunit amino acid transport protein